jgi:hypothetical protein
MQSFVDIVVGQGVDPAKLVERTESRVLKLFTDATAVPVRSVAFASAAYRAARTLAFISPDALTQQFLASARSDLDPQNLDFIGAQELGIWATPEGSLFVDVLAKKSVAAPPTANRNNALDKWEKEVRESAAKKKAATANGALSKADQALVAQQTKVEADVKARIQAVQQQMERGLAVIRSLITADVEPFKAHLTDVLQLIMNGPLDKGSFLVGDDAFRTFLRLGDCCSPRLESLRSFIGIAILRNFGTLGIPEQYTEEPLDGLLLRVLYRLRTLSEHAPFDSTTYAYITPLLTTVIAKGATGGLAASDEITEQLALVLEIMDFHCGECASAASLFSGPFCVVMLTLPFPLVCSRRPVVPAPVDDHRPRPADRHAASAAQVGRLGPHQPRRGHQAQRDARRDSGAPQGYTLAGGRRPQRLAPSPPAARSDRLRLLERSLDRRPRRGPAERPARPRHLGRQRPRRARHLHREALALCRARQRLRPHERRCCHRRCYPAPPGAHRRDQRRARRALRRQGVLSRSSLISCGSRTAC